MLTVILLLPIPTTPALIFFIIKQGVVDASIIYLSASTLNSLVLYFVGLNFQKIRVLQSKSSDLFLKFKNSTIIKITLKKFVPKNFQSIDPAKLFKNATVYDIAIARITGIHNHFIMFCMGLLSTSPVNGLIANFGLACIDLVFYWFVIGQGNTVVQLFFPNADITQIIQSETVISLFLMLTVLFYIIYIIYRITKSKSKNQA